jgi:hypothetical protein
MSVSSVRKLNNDHNLSRSFATERPESLLRRVRIAGVDAIVRNVIPMAY